MDRSRCRFLCVLTQTSQFCLHRGPYTPVSPPQTLFLVSLFSSRSAVVAAVLPQYNSSWVPDRKGRRLVCLGATAVLAVGAWRPRSTKASLNSPVVQTWRAIVFSSFTNIGSILLRDEKSRVSGAKYGWSVMMRHGSLVYPEEVRNATRNETRWVGAFCITYLVPGILYLVPGILCVNSCIMFCSCGRLEFSV